MSQSLNDVSIGDIAYYLSNDLPEFNGSFVLSNVGFITKDKTKKGPTLDFNSFEVFNNEIFQLDDLGS